MKRPAGVGRSETPMHDFEFVLTFALPHAGESAEDYLDALFEAGCDDASVGVGQAGMIGLDFTRRAPSAEVALRSAIKEVGAAIPGARFVQAGPDLVGLSDMAEMFDCSRQNMRKYATGSSKSRAAFPLPTVLGDPTLWHLAEIIAWLGSNTAMQPSPQLCAVARAAAVVNFEVEVKRVQQILQSADAVGEPAGCLSRRSASNISQIG